MEYVIPLRESFALPFLWLQLAGITYYFKHNVAGLNMVLYVCDIWKEMPTDHENEGEEYGKKSCLWDCKSIRICCVFSGPECSGDPCGHIFLRPFLAVQPVHSAAAGLRALLFPAAWVRTFTQGQSTAKQQNHMSPSFSRFTFLTHFPKISRFRFGWCIMRSGFLSWL